MASPNTTFKLTADDLLVLETLSSEMSCSRTEVLRRALAGLKSERDRRRAIGQAFFRRLFESLPEGSMFMIGLDHELGPYVTVDGRERRDDVEALGEQIRVDSDDYVRVYLCDREHEARYAIGIVPSSGGWLALDQPPALKIA